MSNFNLNDDNNSYNQDNFVSYSEYSNNVYADNANSEGRQGNWPDFLVEKKNQQIYGVLSILLTMFFGILAIIMPIYYLFILDNDVDIEKDGAAKVMSYIALLLPIVSTLLAILFFIPLFFMF